MNNEEQFKPIIFGERLKKLRQENGYTFNQLASKLGKSRTIIFNWENKGAVPQLDSAIAIADLFDVSLDYLVGREKPNKKTEETKTTIEAKKTIEDKPESMEEVFSKFTTEDILFIFNMVKLKYEEIKRRNPQEKENDK